MNSVPSIALSGLGAATQRLDAVAMNLANAQTPGYRRELVQQSAAPEGGVSTQVGLADQPGEDLAADLVDRMMASYAFAANVRVITTHQTMVGALLDVQA
jgi:flagellar hook protein FlgE